MMNRPILFLLFTLSAWGMASIAQAQSNYEPYLFVTFAGVAPSRGSADGIGSAARFYYPSGVAADSAGNVYVADTSNDTIRKITPTGVVSTLAGLAGTPGSDDGIGSAARFFVPTDLAADAAGNVYVADSGNSTIRKITPFGVVTTVAGLAENAGSADGTGSAARFAYPSAVAIDSTGNLFVADTRNFTIREITPAGAVTTIAGLAGNNGSADGTGGGARFNSPSGITVDSAGDIYVADLYNYTIRHITPTGVVTTVAGSPGIVGSTDGIGSSALFNTPISVVVDNGNLYVADAGNNAIRKIRPDAMVSTFAGSAVGGAGSVDGSGSAVRFSFPFGVAVDAAGNVYVADTSNNTIRSITPNGVVITLAGLAGSHGSADGTGTAARFWAPTGVGTDTAGNVFVADNQNHTIRKITPAGVVSTFAGLANNSGRTDGTGSAARFNQPQGVAVDTAGNVYVADTNNCIIRKITPQKQVTTLAGSSNCTSRDGTGSAAGFSFPLGIAVDSSGNLYVSDNDVSTIRKITPDGQVTTLAGSTNMIGSADGTGSAARFTYPGGVAADSAGNVYVADFGNYSIRKITPAAVVTTLGGLHGSYSSTDGTGSVARFNQPEGVAVDSSGDVYVADDGNSTIRVGGTTPVQLFSVGSTKSHSNLGTWDVNLPLLPVTASRGIECRSGGANDNYSVVFTFGNNLASVGGASVTSGLGFASSAAIDPTDSHRYLVDLTGVTNAQYVTVTLSNVTDVAGNSAPSISQQMGVLIGDTNGDGVVNVGDTIQVRLQAGSTVTSSNFRMDLNVDGLINVGDTIIVKNQSGTALPTQQAQPVLLKKTSGTAVPNKDSGATGDVPRN